MGGLSLLLLQGRERTAGAITGILFLIAAAVSPQPRRTIIDGQEVVEPILFGYVYPMWVLVAVLIPLLWAVHTGLHRLLLHFWPETETETETITVDRLYDRAEGGYVAWKGEDSDAGSPFEYTVPRLETASDYLRAEETSPLQSLVLGDGLFAKDGAAFHAEIDRWLREASDETLADLIPAARETKENLYGDVLWRLIDASEARGIPTFAELTAYAEETDDAELRDYLAKQISPS